MAALHSKGTDIFFAVNDTLYHLACPTGVNVPRATKEQTDITCLGDLNRRFQPGLGTPPTVSVNGNFDPDEATHVALYNFQETGDEIRWFVGLPGSTAAPDFDSAGNVILPTTRSWVWFDGYVSDSPIDIQLDALITIEFIIQMNGNSTLVPRVITP